MADTGQQDAIPTITQSASNTDNPTGAEDTQAPQAENGDKPEGKVFSQAELDAIVKDRLDRERKRQEKAAEKASQEAEAAALAEQQKWEELAVKREGENKTLGEKLEELEPQLETAQARIAALEAVVRNQVETVTADVDPGIKALLASKPIEDQLAWWSEHGANFTANGARNIPASPRAEPEAASEADRASGRQRLARSVRNWM